MSLFPSKTFAAASLLLLGSMATFMLSSQQQSSVSSAWFGRDMHTQRFKGDHPHHDDNGGVVASGNELEIWEGDWYGPYNHAKGEWRVFWIPMVGNECCCRTWSDFAGTDTTLFMTDDPNYVLDSNWAGWDAIAPKGLHGAKETATISKNSNKWQCFAAVYGVTDTDRAGILCVDSAVSRIDMDSEPKWAH